MSKETFLPPLPLPCPLNCYRIDLVFELKTPLSPSGRGRDGGGGGVGQEKNCWWESGWAFPADVDPITLLLVRRDLDCSPKSQAQAETFMCEKGLTWNTPKHTLRSYATAIPLLGVGERTESTLTGSRNGKHGIGNAVGGNVRAMRRPEGWQRNRGTTS